MMSIKITDYAMYDEVEEMKTACGNPVDDNSFRLISGNFYEGETVVVEHIASGKKYTRKVRNDAWDLYVTIKNSKCYWDCNRVD